jgi:hypothetical protein
MLGFSREFARKRLRRMVLKQLMESPERKFGGELLGKLRCIRDRGTKSLRAYPYSVREHRRLVPDS